jgi:hypothetical protein
VQTLVVAAADQVRPVCSSTISTSPSITT